MTGFVNHSSFFANIPQLGYPLRRLQHWLDGASRLLFRRKIIWDYRRCLYWCDRRLFKQAVSSLLTFRLTGLLIKSYTGGQRSLQPQRLQRWVYQSVPLIRPVYQPPCQHYATQIKLCHREQAGGKKHSKNSSPPSAKTMVTRGKEKAATTTKSRGRQTTSSRASADADSPSSYTRRKVAEIRRDVRDAKVDYSTPLPYLGESGRSDREYDGEVEVVRTEPLSLALRAQVMAATGHGESTWMLEGWSPGPEEGPPQIQDGLYGAMTWDSSSLPLEPRLPYPQMSSRWPNPPFQSHPEAVPARVRAIEGFLSRPSARTQSPVSRPPRPRPQSLQMPYSSFLCSPPSVTHSAPSTITPPPSAVSTSFAPPRPPVPSRSTSWAQHPTPPIIEQAIPAYASSPEPPTHLLQAPSQQGYFVHYQDSNRMSDPRNPPHVHFYS